MSDQQFIKISDKIKVFAFPFLVGILSVFLIGFYNNQSEQNKILKDIQKDINENKSDFKLLELRTENNQEKISKIEDRVNNYEKIFIKTN